jgi:hypothetical protein
MREKLCFDLLLFSRMQYITHRPEVQHERKRPLSAAFVRKILRILKRSENEMVTMAHHYAAVHPHRRNRHDHREEIDFSKPTDVVIRTALAFETRLDSHNRLRRAMDITDPYFMPFEDSDIVPISCD